MHLFYVGDYDDVLIVAERVVSIQAVIQIDRAGQAIAPPAYREPSFDGSMVTLDNGTTISVPQSVDEVGRRISEAIVRQSVMPL